MLLSVMAIDYDWKSKRRYEQRRLYHAKQVVSLRVCYETLLRLS